MRLNIKKSIFFTFRFLFRSIIIALTLICLGVIILFGRLSVKPINLESFMPEIQSYIFPTDSHFKIHADSIILSAKLTRDGLFHIDAQNISLHGKDNVLILDLPKAKISYGLLHLLTLNYMPKTIQFDNPLLQLTLTKKNELLLQDPDIPITSDIADTTPIDDDTSDAFVVKDIQQGIKHILSFKRFSLNDASIVIADQKTGRRIVVPELDFQIKKRRFHKYNISIKTSLRVKRQTMHLQGSANLDTVSKTASFDFLFDNLNLTHAGRVIPLFKGLNLTLQGEISGTFDFTKKHAHKHWRHIVKELQFTINTLKEGTVQLPEPLNTIYPVSYLVATGNFEENLDSLKIMPITTSLTTGLSADSDITVTGIGSFLDKSDFNEVKTIINARLKNVPINEVPSVWPSYLGTTAHAWVEKNISDGTATSALFSLFFIGTDLSNLLGDINFKDVTVNYLSPMKPVKKASGKVMLYPDKVEIFATTGQINNIKLNTGNVFLTNLKDEISHAKIELDASGPIQEILSLINSKPLELLSEFNINPSQIKGTAKGKVTLHFPLTTSLTAKQVEVEAKATLDNGSFKSTDGLIDLNKAKLTANVTNNGLVIEGKGQYQNYPVLLKWSEFFMPTKQNPIKSVYAISGIIDDSFLKRFYKDITDYLIGSIGIQLVYQKEINQPDKIQLNADLSQTELMLYPIAYTKLKEIPANLNIEIAMPQQQGMKTTQFSFESNKKTVVIDGSIQQNPEKTTIRLNNIHAPETDFSATMTYTKQKDLSLKLKGKSWSMTELKNIPYFKKDETQSTENHKKLSPKQPIFANMDIDVSLDSLTLKENLPIKQLIIKANRNHSKWNNLFITASGKDITSINFNPKTQKIEGIANNLGDLFARLNLSDSFTNGKALLNASQDNQGIISGEIKIKDLDLKEPGFLTQALTILGIIDAFRGNKLNFSTGSIPFSLTPQYDITFQDSVIYGTSLGITFVGDIISNQIHLTGSIVPAYAVNSLPGRIPVIGNLFKDTQHGGLVGVNYSLKGTPSNPKIEFHTLSSIAPGILGRLFK